MCAERKNTDVTHAAMSDEYGCGKGCTDRANISVAEAAPSDEYGCGRGCIDHANISAAKAALSEGFRVGLTGILLIIVGILVVLGWADGSEVIYDGFY